MRPRLGELRAEPDNSSPPPLVRSSGRSDLVWKREGSHASGGECVVGRPLNLQAWPHFCPTKSVGPIIRSPGHRIESENRAQARLLAHLSALILSGLLDYGHSNERSRHQQTLNCGPTLSLA